MHYEINYACVSHIGKIRSINQDNLICDGRYMDIEEAQKGLSITGSVNTKNTSLFGVFDGMGGEEYGEVASYLAAKNAAEIQPQKDGVMMLSEYCEKANSDICNFAENNSVSAMGTTAAMLLFTDNEITLCNIGDSKVFRVSSGDMKQISEDHVAISIYGRKPPLTQHLGIPPYFLLIDPYFSKYGYEDGDRYLICSDGLTDMVSDEEIVKCINENKIDSATQILLEKSLENGGRDNVTVVLLEIKQK